MLTLWGGVFLGFFLLYIGAESLIRGASRMGIRLRVRPIVIGLTVVAFGTSLPEGVVSVLATLAGKPDLASGNVIGSNIINIALALGLAAALRPLRVEQNATRREIPFVIGSALLLTLFAWDGRLVRWEGMVLLAAFAAFLRLCFQKPPEEAKKFSAVAPAGSNLTDTFFILTGLAGLAVGARLLVDNSVDLAARFGVPELLIGLTLVAAGTSLPEIATSVVASLRKKDDLSVGNVAGSNVFNTLLVLGLCAVLRPVPVGADLFGRDLPVMLVLSILLFPMLRSGFRVTRWDGAFLLAAYGFYLGWLLRSARP